jgi:hypothetical protein
MTKTQIVTQPLEGRRELCEIILKRLTSPRLVNSQIYICKKLTLGERKEMDDRRRFHRLQTQMRAQYFLKEKKGGWEECTVIDVSRKGVGIKFHKPKNIPVGSVIHLEVFPPKELEPVVLNGVLKRIEQEGDDLIGGVELKEVLDGNKLARLG